MGGFVRLSPMSVRHFCRITTLDRPFGRIANLGQLGSAVPSRYISMVRSRDRPAGSKPSRRSMTATTGLANRGTPKIPAFPALITNSASTISPDHGADPGHLCRRPECLVQRV